MKFGGVIGASFLVSVNGPSGESLTAIIVARIEFVGECVERVGKCAAIQARPVSRLRFVGNTGDRKADTFIINDRSARHNGEIAVPACNLPKSIAASRGHRE